MDLYQLRYFVAVAEERSFTRAAAREHVVQSAVSAAVARLEREFGNVLFDRSGRSTALTEAGHVLLGRARVVLGEAQRIRDEMSLLATGVTGTVTLGTVLSTGSFDLISALGAFRTANPGVAVRLRLSHGPIDDHLDALLAGHFDLALLPATKSRSREVSIQAVARMTMALACRADDPLAQRAAVALHDLRDRSFVDFPEDWGNRTVIDGLFADAGVERTVAFEVIDVATALRMVAARLGLAFVPSESIGTDPSLTTVALADAPPVFTVGLAMPRDRPASHAVQALHDGLLGWAGRSMTG